MTSSAVINSGSVSGCVWSYVCFSFQGTNRKKKHTKFLQCVQDWNSLSGHT